MADPERFHGFHGTPLLKGCLRNYYAQTCYLYTYTTLKLELRTHNSNNACVSINFVYQEFDAGMAYVNNKASELKQRLYSCIAPSAARDGDTVESGAQRPID